jgi:hypothetical protein
VFDEGENDKLKEDMVYKLSVYGAYLPEVVLDSNTGGETSNGSSNDSVI